MQDYLKKLSTFRMLVLFLLLMATGFYVYGYYREDDSTVYKDESYKDFYEALRDKADAFSYHINVQRSLGVALAISFELVEEGVDSAGDAGKTLNQALARAPEFILGAGIFFPGNPELPKVFAYVEREPTAAGDLIPMITGRQQRFPDAAHGSPGSRKIYWTVTQEGTAPESLISSVLTVGLNNGSGGEVMVNADLRWVERILVEIREIGVAFPMCVTPDGQILRLDGSALALEPERAAGVGMEKTLAHARAVSLRHNAAETEFLTSDILGSGWFLAFAKPGIEIPRHPLQSIAAFLFIVAMAAIAFELIISKLASVIIPSGESGRHGVSSGLAAPGGGIRKALSDVHKFLFQYRIANPDQERIDSELRVARQIQFSLLPGTFPAYSEWREFDLYSLLSPAREVSGDYYDFFMLDSNRMVLSVADVSGKGMPAALYMAVSRTAFRTLARRAADPGELFGSLNDMLVRESNSGLYVTIACFFVNLHDGKCQYSLAGHPSPLLHDQSSGVSRFIDDPRQTFIGMKAGLKFPVGELRLAPGDTLLFYSDGVPEARNAAGDDLDYAHLRERFDELVGQGNCQDLIANLDKSILTFVGEREQEDDITLMAFRYWGSGGQKMLKRRQRQQNRSSRNAAAK